MLSLNNELLQTFKNFDPDIVVLGHADKIHNKTLENFKSIKKIKIIEWNVDNYYLDNKEKFTKIYLIDAFLLQMQISRSNMSEVRITHIVFLIFLTYQ